MTHLAVVLSRNIGECWSVTIEPPVPGMQLNDAIGDFEGACGYAASIAANLFRPLVDITGTLSETECSELVLRAAIKMAVEFID